MSSPSSCTAASHVVLPWNELYVPHSLMSSRGRNVLNMTILAPRTYVDLVESRLCWVRLNPGYQCKESKVGAINWRKVHCICLTITQIVRDAKVVRPRLTIAILFPHFTDVSRQVAMSSNKCKLHVHRSHSRSVALHLRFFS
jgi:hypothetical protein